MTTRRGNLGVEKNSRIAKRYTMPATAKEPMKDGPPLPPELSEQIVSATHKMTPSTHTLLDGVNFTVLPCPSAILPPHVPILQATPPCAALSPEPDATPLPAESDRQSHRHRRKDLRNPRKAQELVPATGVSRAH